MRQPSPEPLDGQTLHDLIGGWPAAEKKEAEELCLYLIEAQDMMVWAERWIASVSHAIAHG